jgi:hypothetical protein
VLIQKVLVNVPIAKGVKRNKCAAMVSEARLPIRCCPEVKNGKPSGPSSPFVRIATALDIYK